MRVLHVLAVGVAGAIVGGGAYFCYSTRANMVEEFRESLRQAKAAGNAELADVDPETATMDGYAVEPSPGQMQRVMIADLLRKFWFVIVPAVCLLCLGAATAVERVLPTADLPQEATKDPGTTDISSHTGGD